MKRFHKNPSKTTFRYVLEHSTCGVVKGLIVEGLVYIWDAFILDHTGAARQLGIDYMNGEGESFQITSDYGEIVATDRMDLVHRFTFLEADNVRDINEPV